MAQSGDATTVREHDRSALEGAFEQVSYSIRSPEIARAITSRWISDVPSKMV
jgi:hypothetical protein